MEHKSLKKLQADLDDALAVVDIQANYRHSKSGVLYQALGLLVLEATDQIMVRYSSVEKPSLEFCRPVDEFIETINLNGVNLPRFERC